MSLVKVVVDQDAPQPEAPDTGTNTDADPLLKAQAEKNRVITESAR